MRRDPSEPPVAPKKPVLEVRRELVLYAEDDDDNWDARNLPPISKPLIYVTAHGRRYTSERLMLTGADKVIVKPVNFDDLTNAVAELIQDRTSS